MTLEAPPETFLRDRYQLLDAHIYVAQSARNVPRDVAIRERKSGYTILSKSNSVGTRRETTDAS